METPTQLLKIRNDKAGSGEFGSSRDGGSRTHSGVDFISKPESQVLTPVSGKITKLGYPYADDLSYRYVQITDEEGNKHRMFYVQPGKELAIGQQVFQYDPIGIAQDVSRRYPDRGMTPHVHYEIKDKLGKFIDPTTNS
ncbi:MAG: M23 family peptidase [Epsilonproteobacteria bacterium]|nr:MAG: M23 family peptidase [Campylobacterota bacterium]